MDDKRQPREDKTQSKGLSIGGSSDFVLEKHIFSNVFEKDIRRVFMYKKAERIAKSIHLIVPAFSHAPELRKRFESIAVALIVASVESPHEGRQAMSKDLLVLSSILSVARESGFLSPMNADLISREVHHLLQELAAYEDPRIILPEIPTLAELARTKNAPQARPIAETAKGRAAARPEAARGKNEFQGHSKGHVISDASRITRRETILSVLKGKESAYIRDISSLIRGVSEKTIQRELQGLVQDGLVVRSGERRWTQYSIPNNAPDELIPST